MTVPVDLRSELKLDDPSRIRALVRATGFFSAAEEGIAAELAEETLTRGAEAGYAFLLADAGEELAGYACFGPIPGSDWSWDLYWIAVAPNYQGRGLGRRLLAAVEAHGRLAGAGQLYIETSARSQYAATRDFYWACGYQVAAELPDFYRPGDGKIIFVRVLAG